MSEQSPPSFSVICIGEILWDSLPRGLFLGGAPFNVACHLHALGGDASIVSRTGTDTLGSIIRQRVTEKGLTDKLIQIDENNPTGLVLVALDSHGNPTYDIVKPSAWDFLVLDDRLEQELARARAIVFGSLAQRSPVSRQTIQSILKKPVLRVFDVNLRPPYDLKDVVRFGLDHADLVKLNDQELLCLSRWFDLPAEPRKAAEKLAREFEVSLVCVTRGAHGSAMWKDGRWTEHQGYQIAPRDTVGAGDGFLASLILGYVCGDSDETMLENANAFGAFIATQEGATPEHDPSAIMTLKKSQSAPKEEG